MNTPESIKIPKDTVNLVGIGLSRSVFLNSEFILIDQSKKIIDYGSDDFDWGYFSNGTKQLGLAILSKLIHLELAEKYAEDFARVILCNINNDFDINVDYAKFLEFAKGSVNMQDLGDKLIHANLFSEFRVGDNYLSSFLNLNIYLYNEFIFERGTVEYELLSELDSNDLKYLSKYLGDRTWRKDKDDPNRNICMVLECSDDYFKFTKGLGSGTYHGLPSNKYLSKF